MEVKMIIGYVAGIVSFLAYLLYIFTTIQGKTKPHRVTWWVLTLIGVMIALSFHASGARETIWIAISYILGPGITAILSIKYGEGGWEKLDIFCLVGALISAVVWYLSNSPALVLGINLLMDLLGLIPTIKKSYLRPEGEDRLAWTLECVASAINIGAITKWSFALTLYPFYLLVVNSIIALLLYRPIWMKRRKRA